MPVRMLRVGDHDSEWAGLLLHRRPDACSYGYLVTLPFRGSALYLPLDSEQALPGVPIFARRAAEAFRRASQFDDQLYAKLLWLQPDGNVEVLCDLFDPPPPPSSCPPPSCERWRRHNSKTSRAPWPRHASNSMARHARAPAL